MNRRTVWTLMMAPIFSAALAACSGDTGAGQSAAAEQALAAAPAELVITTRDFVFEMPDTIIAGPTTFRLVNEGPDFHHVWMLRLEDGKTMNDLLEIMAKGEGPLPEWAIDVGGPNTPGAAGEETNATIDLKPGSYVAMCVIPASDGMPHIMKGMVKPVTVVGPARHAEMPAADIVMTLDDFSFDTDRPIAPGRHTIRVTNVAPQAHEVLIVKLQPGRTAAEFVQFIVEPKGEIPGLPVGGTTGLKQGEDNVITLEFEPGTYALICFVPDAGDGKPHVEHGMLKEIQVG